jgi:hypothetical protein
VGSITLEPNKKGLLVARLELTGERIELVLQEAARGLRVGSQQNQAAIKMVAGVRYSRYIRRQLLTRDHPLLLAA